MVERASGQHAREPWFDPAQLQKYFCSEPCLISPGNSAQQLSFKSKQTSLLTGVQFTYFLWRDLLLDSKKIFKIAAWKGVVSYFLWLSIFQFLANRGRFCFVIRLTWGFWGRRCRLWHFWIVLGTFCIRIRAQNGSILAQFLARVPCPAASQHHSNVTLYYSKSISATLSHTLFC